MPLRTPSDSRQGVSLYLYLQLPLWQRGIPGDFTSFPRKRESRKGHLHPHIFACSSSLINTRDFSLKHLYDDLQGLIRFSVYPWRCLPMGVRSLAPACSNRCVTRSKPRAMPVRSWACLFHIPSQYRNSLVSSRSRACRIFADTPKPSGRYPEGPQGISQGFYIGFLRHDAHLSAHLPGPRGHCGCADSANLRFLLFASKVNEMVHQFVPFFLGVGVHRRNWMACPELRMEWDDRHDFGFKYLLCEVVIRNPVSCGSPFL